MRFQRCMLCYLTFGWLLLVVFLGTEGLGQTPQRHDDTSIRLETVLVQVPVVVKDPGGRYITNLSERDFRLFENGVEQHIEFVKPVEEPFSVALLLDSSGSTVEQLNLIKDAALAFVDNLRAHDRVMVVSFNDSVEVICGLTNNKAVLRDSIIAVRPGEYTQVYEAVYTAVWERLQDVEGRKAVILFTDGIDTASSEIVQEDTFDAILESEDVIIYPIRYNTRPDVDRKMELRFRGRQVGTEPRAGVVREEESRRELDRSYREADSYLFELARLSGGIVEYADTLRDLGSAFGRIAEELRHQYLIGYYPSDLNKANKDRRINVRVNRDNVRIRTRPSYKISSPAR